MAGKRKATTQGETGMDAGEIVPVPAGSPIKELLSPPARAAGKELAPLGRETGAAVTRAGRLILAPFRGLIWSGEKIVQFIEEKIEAKLKDIPKESIVSPDPQVTGPALEALRYCASKEEIVNLFASLIANSMIKEIANNVHPSFVEIIKQITPAEAAFLKATPLSEYIAITNFRLRRHGSDGYTVVASDIIIKYDHIFAEKGGYSNVAINNMARLGLFRILYGTHLTGENAYEHIENSQTMKKYRDEYKEIGSVDIEKGIVEMTPYGKMFVDAIKK